MSILGIFVLSALGGFLGGYFLAGLSKKDKDDDFTNWSR